MSMRDPEDLLDLSLAGDVPAGLPLIVAMPGFADAGQAAEIVARHLLRTLPHHLVATFAADELLDYRARRPQFTFSESRITELSPHRIAVHSLEDDAGEQFLLLEGPEPDFQWERFTAAVEILVERLRVSSVTTVLSIPMPVPHTRPLGVTISGTRDDLVERRSVWKPTTVAPASVAHYLEFALTEVGHEVTGVVVLVPHYLADTASDGAALAALDVIADATGLLLPTDQLRERDRELINQIAEQIDQNEALQDHIQRLEERYDAYMADQPLASPLTSEDGSVPSADAIAKEFEEFLGGLRRDDPFSK